MRGAFSAAPGKVSSMAKVEALMEKQVELLTELVKEVRGQKRGNEDPAVAAAGLGKPAAGGLFEPC